MASVSLLDAPGEDLAKEIDLRRWPNIKSLTLVALALLLASVFFQRPIYSDCSDTMLGAWALDAEGSVWTAWNWEASGTGPWPEESPYIAAPQGQSSWQPSHLSTSVVYMIVWGFAQVLEPVCAWNISILIGFIFSGLIMYAVVWKLTGNVPASLFAAFVFTFSPYRQLKAEAHITQLYAGLFPLLFYEAWRVWDTRYQGNGLVLGLWLAVLAYTDPYFILMAPIAVAVISIFGFWRLMRTKNRSSSKLKESAKGTILAAMILIVGVLPMILFLFGDSNEEPEAVVRPMEELVTYSARPWEYVLPTVMHPLNPKALHDWQDRKLHNSNVAEQNLTIGFIPLGLAIYGFSRRRRDDMRSYGFLLGALASVVVVCFLFSMPPSIQIGGLTLTMPSGLTYQFFPYLRTYSRFVIPVHAAVVMMAAIGMTRVLRNISARKQAVVTVGIIALVAFEFLTFPPRHFRSYSRTKPEIYHWLADESDVSVIAEYPMKFFYDKTPTEYLAAQPIHEKRMVNPAVLGDRQQKIRTGLFGLADPQTIPILRAWRTDLVVLHRGMYGAPLDAPLPEGIELVKDYGDDEAYRLKPGPTRDTVLHFVSGFHETESKGWESFTWMRTRGTLSIARIGGQHRRATASFLATSAFGTRDLSVRQGGKTLWEGKIGDVALVQFEADVEKPITLETSPGTTVIASRLKNNDNRSVSIGIWSLSASELPS